MLSVVKASNGFLRGVFSILWTLRVLDDLIAGPGMNRSKRKHQGAENSEKGHFFHEADLNFHGKESPICRNYALFGG
jgi:hypothetical protein